ncbi:MAG: hypothetical protein AB7I32_13390, partial [Gammaproteobacteria bacterium]
MFDAEQFGDPGLHEEFLTQWRVCLTAFSAIDPAGTIRRRMVMRSAREGRVAEAADEMIVDETRRLQ